VVSMRHWASAVPVPLRVPLRRVRDASTGRWPRQVAYWNLARTDPMPETFTDKIRWRMAYDRRPILQTFADKVAVRDYVADRIGDEHLSHLYGVHARSDQVDWAALPQEFVAKASHGSGAVVIVWEGAPLGSRLPANAGQVEWDRFAVRPDVTVRPRLAALIDRWMALDFEFGPGRLPEWAYRGVPPRVIVEELLLDADGGVPRDYKFYVFDGSVQMFQVDTARYGHHQREFFRSDGSPLEVVGSVDRPTVSSALPASLPRMLEIAAELARGMDFLRVDLYDLPDRIVFGELTSTPGAGAVPLQPREFDRELGTYWRLPEPSVVPSQRS
jgi:hypothetical protein